VDKKYEQELADQQRLSQYLADERTRLDGRNPKLKRPLPLWIHEFEDEGTHVLGRISR
jgi:hypothetical protein